MTAAIFALLLMLGVPIAFVLLENFAIDLIDRERFNTVIGFAFLLIILFSPDGLIGLWSRIRAKIRFERYARREPRSADQSDSDPAGTLKKTETYEWRITCPD